MDALLAVARLLQFAGAVTLGGGALFFLYGMTREAEAGWRRPLLASAAALGALATLGWLMLQSASLMERASAAFDPAAVWSLATGTSFGRGALVRLVLQFATLIGLALFARPWRATAVLGLLATLSFAWTGHGATDDGLAGLLHLGADLAHLAAAALWLGALAPLAILLIRCGREPAAVAAANLGLSRFSGIGPAVVAVLVLSGLVNGWFLVGPAHALGLAESLYGRLLLAKLVLFALMLALAAGNRFRLAPRLLAARGGDVRAATAALRASVLAETALAVLVLALVAWLGVLAPPIAGEG